MNRSVHRKLPLQLTAFTLTVFTDFLRYLPKSMALIAEARGGGKGLSGLVH